MDAKIKELVDASCLAVTALNWIPNRTIGPVHMKSYDIVKRLEKALLPVIMDMQEEERSSK